MVVALLTSTSNCELNTTWMPGSDTRDLTQTLVGLSWQLLGVPTAGHTLESATFRDTYHVNHLILREDLINCHRLFEMLASKIDFLWHGSTIELHLHNVRLLLSLLHQACLGMNKNSDNCAVLLYVGQILVDVLPASWVLPFLGILRKRLLLGSIPRLKVLDENRQRNSLVNKAASS